MIRYLLALWLALATLHACATLAPRWETEGCATDWDCEFQEYVLPTLEAGRV